MTIDHETRLLLTAYHDGGLSAGEVLAFEKRLAAEPELRQALDEVESLSQSLSAAFARQPAAPDALRDRILSLAEASPGTPFAAASTTNGNGGSDEDEDPADIATLAALSAMARGLPRRSGPSWPALAASLVVGAVLGALTMTAFDRQSPLGSGPDRTVLDAVVDSHLRALAANQPFEIASSDRHVVKPWFNGRTTIAPNAPDLADQGFPLIGGRVDVIDAEPVPSLVYRHDLHVISVTITASPATSGAEKGRDGTTVEEWRDDGLTYWAASDLNATDLRRFVAMFRQRTSPAP
ncbi:MAG: anti-sigma factor [Neorhizobium sp.]|nr:anti-sigma factor [Neorhizobium sp.]